MVYMVEFSVVAIVGLTATTTLVGIYLGLILLKRSYGRHVREFLRNHEQQTKHVRKTKIATTHQMRGLNLLSKEMKKISENQTQIMKLLIPKPKPTTQLMKIQSKSPRVITYVDKHNAIKNFLINNNGRASFSQIVDAKIVSRATTSKLLKQMISNGMIKQHENKGDYFLNDKPIVDDAKMPENTPSE